jgi:hypothetical protein
VYLSYAPKKKGNRQDIEILVNAFLLYYILCTCVTVPFMIDRVNRPLRRLSGLLRRPGAREHFESSARWSPNLKCSFTAQKLFF